MKAVTDLLVSVGKPALICVLSGALIGVTDYIHDPNVTAAVLDAAKVFIGTALSILLGNGVITPIKNAIAANRQ